jgi:hypothetical protein
MRLWHGADTLRWCEARERVDEQLDVAELEARVEDLEWQVQDQAATVRKVLRGEHADVEALRKAIEAAIE